MDLCPIVEGGTAADAFRDAVDLARHAERLGYERYWVAEHHNIPGVASAATAVVIGHVAGGTSRIRVGAGGIMLPNHAPLVIAEQFGTLASLYPGRIDLGLGRAPGGDQRTARALRRYQEEVDAFPRDVREVQNYFRPAGPGRFVHAIPGEGLDVPIWILGSSDFGARLAAELGLPYAFASHFAPDQLFDALAIYRENFIPSEALEKPYAMIGVNAFLADTDEAAVRLFSSHQQAILNLVRGRPGLLPPPVDDVEALWTPFERAHVDKMTRVSVVGSPETVRGRLQSLVNAVKPDEVVFSGHIYDHAARLRSYDLLMQVCRTSAAAEAASLPSSR
nr:LLM class flavin-dependent oxidoreductase [Paludisphaera mucosa]